MLQKTRLVCDSNIFFGLASGRLDENKLRKKGQIWLSPVFVYELASNLTVGNLSRRRSAAACALRVTDGILPDPEEHLISVWNVSNASREKFPWRDILTAVSSARTLQELRLGVADVTAGVRRSVDVDGLALEREHQYKSFEAEMIDAIDKVFPGYSAARQTGKSITPNKEEAALLEQGIMSSETQRGVLLSTRNRACLVAGVTPGKPETTEIESAARQLVAYARMYCGYALEVATMYSPRANDWGDLEHCIYLGIDDRFVTAEKKWHRIASNVGLQDLVLDPSTF